MPISSGRFVKKRILRKRCRSEPLTDAGVLVTASDEDVEVDVAPFVTQRAVNY